MKKPVTEDRFCPWCGRDVEATFCDHCGKDIDDD